jgi:NADPH2 dehydrogenase
MNKLFSEKSINASKIKNRIVMAPMVCFGYAKEDGLVTGKNIEHYEARAKGGVGLIIVEATCVNKNGRLADSQLGIWSEDHVEGLRKLTDACHNFDVKVIIQIHHAGFKTPKNISIDRISSSDYIEGEISARALSVEEINSLQTDFINAAVRAKKAGFDGIELHGAHGYLLSQFFSPLINKREDLYGGNIVNRARFATEIITGIKEKLGKDFIIGVRMGGNEPTLEQGIEIAKELEKAGADLLHVSSGMQGEEGFQAPKDFQYNSIVYNAIQIKKSVKVPVIAVNGIKTPDRAKFLIDNDMVDFIAIGKGLLVDADWANKAEKEININSCLECRRCMWFKSGELCPKMS